MTRQKTYNPTDVIERAMPVFWQKGYAATSVTDLVEATGVQRYGLYDSFTDKHTLFLQVLDHYQESVIMVLFEDLNTEGASWFSIQTFFSHLLALAAEPDGRYGCLMCNSATELAAHDVAVAQRFGDYENQITAIFTQAIQRSQAAGELGPSLDAMQAANFLMGVVIGVATLAKTRLSWKAQQQYVAVALQGLEALAQA